MYETMMASERQWLDTLAGKICAKMARVSEKSKHKIPYSTLNGVHDDKATSDELHHEGIFWWTNGFWAGLLWQMYQASNRQGRDAEAERYASIASYTETVFDRCLDGYYGLHHDAGFMFLHSAVADYRLRGNADGRRRGLHAANLLAGRFNPAGRFIRAWNNWTPDSADNRGWAIIDCMMNLPLLYWASEESGDPRFRHIALAHAETAMRYFIREDGSANHIVEFDPETGVFVKTYGGQGYGEGSSWTRGQAWALYGFMLNYLHTKKTDKSRPDFLETAKKVADYVIAHIPESGLMPVDFKQPPEPAWEDSTASAIASCGLLELYRETADERYYQAALLLLKTLDEKRCDYSEANDCFLSHCSEAYHSNGHHINMVYADYFYIEAIFKLKGWDAFLW